MADLSKRRAAESRGRRAERLALWWLRLKGYRLLARRWTSPAGELDLVMRRGPTVVVIEVKAREDAATALQSIRPQQRRRIERAALAWLQQHGSQTCQLRFDVIAIASGRWPVHIKGAWRSPDHL